MGRLVAVAGLLGLAMLLAGCGDDGDDGGEPADEDRTESTTTEAADDMDDADGDDGDTTTTAPEATTTTVAAEGPEEWVAVLRDVNERWYQLLRDPEPERLSEIFAPECDCYEEKLETIEQLADNGWHGEGQAESVLAVELESQGEIEVFTPEGEQQPITNALVTVKGQAHPLEIVDATGTVVDEFFTDAEPTCVSLSLWEQPGGEYRIHGVRDLTGCPEEWG